jgi:hypothetical protein
VQQERSDRALGAQRARKAQQDQRHLEHDPDGAPAGELGAEVDLAHGDPGAGSDVGDICEEHDLVASSGKRIQQVDVCVLRAAALVRRLD